MQFQFYTDQQHHHQQHQAERGDGLDYSYAPVNRSPTSLLPLPGGAPYHSDARSQSSHQGVPRPPPSEGHHRSPQRQRGTEDDLERNYNGIGKYSYAYNKNNPSSSSNSNNNNNINLARSDIQRRPGASPERAPARTAPAALDEEGEGSHIFDPGLLLQRLGRVRAARKEVGSAPARYGYNDGREGNATSYGQSSANRQEPIRGASVRDLQRLAPAPQWKCGPTRAKLRHKFNRKEIDVLSVMRQYDTNRDWRLEQNEFLVLLQDYNRWFSHITKEEVDMVLQLADFDHDGSIEPNEVLYALRVWFAYVSLPRGAVAQALAQLSDCALPSPEVLKEAMLIMNEEHPVELEEAIYVRDVAIALGATDLKVTTRQMRMAIAAWYLHVERKETGRGELVQHSIGSAHQWLCLKNPLQRCLRGEWDVVTLWLNGLSFIVWVATPALCIYAGKTFQTEEYPCERPMISVLFTLTGITVLVQALMFVWFTSTWECDSMKACKWTAGVALLVVSAVLVLIWVLGIWQVSTTNPSRCGFVVYEIAHYVWIGLPAIALVFLSCCVPCIYCHEYRKHKATDRELMDTGSDSGLE